MNNTRGFPRLLFVVFTAVLYLFLYAPIIILTIYSFNNNPFTYAWTEFTLDWYKQVIFSTEVHDAFVNSLFVAIIAVLISLCLGLLFVFWAQKKYIDRCLPIFYLSLAIPEIVLAVGLLSIFSFFVLPLGYAALVAGHVVLGLGYSVPILYARQKELDKSIVEASYDLGATKTQTFFFVVFPFLTPALIVSALLVFIVSLDDFVISFFCSSASSETLPMYIFSFIQSGATPEVNALCVLLLLISSLVVSLLFWLQRTRLG